MVRKEVDPDMDLSRGASDKSGPMKKVSGSSSDRGSEPVNPDMNLAKSASSQPGPGGKVAASSSDRGNDETVDPDMNLRREGATSEATADEKAQAAMPQVGAMPTGKQAVKKTPSGHGLDE